MLTHLSKDDWSIQQRKIYIFIWENCVPKKLCVVWGMTATKHNFPLEMFFETKLKTIHFFPRKFETLMNFVKALVGTGIYTMPLAFSYVGLLTGIIATIVTAVICTHGVFMLLNSTHKLCRKLNKPSMTYLEVAQASCENGKHWRDDSFFGQNQKNC